VPVLKTPGFGAAAAARGRTRLAAPLTLAVGSPATTEGSARRAPFAASRPSLRPVSRYFYYCDGKR